MFNRKIKERVHFVEQSIDAMFDRVIGFNKEHIAVDDSIMRTLKVQADCIKLLLDRVGKLEKKVNRSDNT